MTTATTGTMPYSTTTLDALPAAEPYRGRSRLPIRSELGIGAFGVNAFRAVEDGGQVIGEHAEDGLGAGRHEELYVVVSGHATFTVDGEEIDGPTGTLVAVQPGVKRRAVARAEGTTVLAVGAPRGEAFTVSPGERVTAMWPHYEAGDYHRAIDMLESALAEREHGLLHYNLACCKALVGRREEAIEHLAAAVRADERFVEHARGDKDLDAIRADPRFVELVPSAG